MSTGGFAQLEWSPCRKGERGAEAVIRAGKEEDERLVGGWGERKVWRSESGSHNALIGILRMGP